VFIRETSTGARNMARAYTIGLMEPPTVVSGEITSLMDKAPTNGLMVASTRESGRPTNYTIAASTRGQMVVDTMASTAKIRNTAGERTFGPTARSMKATGTRVNSMDKDASLTRAEKAESVFGLTATDSSGCPAR